MPDAPKLTSRQRQTLDRLRYASGTAHELAARLWPNFEAKPHLKAARVNRILDDLDALVAAGHFDYYAAPAGGRVFFSTAVDTKASQ